MLTCERHSGHVTIKPLGICGSPLGGNGGLTSGRLTGMWEVGVAGGEVGVGGRGSWGCLVVGEVGPWPPMRRRAAWPERISRELMRALMRLFLAALAAEIVAVELVTSCSWPSQYTNKGKVGLVCEP